MALRDLWTRLRGGEAPASEPAPQASDPGLPPPPVVEPPTPEPPGERPPETPPPSTPEPMDDPTPPELPPDIRDPLAPDSPGAPIEEPRMRAAQTDTEEAKPRPPRPPQDRARPAGGTGCPHCAVGPGRVGARSAAPRADGAAEGRLAGAPAEEVAPADEGAEARPGFLGRLRSGLSRSTRS
jgi:hypothetical protein